MFLAAVSIASIVVGRIALDTCSPAAKWLVVTGAVSIIGALGIVPAAKAINTGVHVKYAVNICMFVTHTLVCVFAGISARASAYLPNTCYQVQANIISAVAVVVLIMSAVIAAHALINLYMASRRPRESLQTSDDVPLVQLPQSPV